MCFTITPTGRAPHNGPTRTWLQYCVNHFEVTNIGTNHDLMELFTEEIEEPTEL